MRYSGFVKEHDNIREAFEFKDLTSASQSLNDKDKIIHFLESGKLIFTWMSGVIDMKNKDRELIHSYLTDGYWIWPSYIIHYLLESSNFKLEDEFIQHIRKNEYKIKLPKNYNIDVISNELTRKFNEDNNSKYGI